VRELLSIGEFKAYVQLRFFMAMGWHMQAVVVAWYVYSITKDPFMLGMVGLAEAIPAIGAAMPLGYWVDKQEKTRSLKIASAMIIGSALLQALVMQPSTLVAMGRSTVLIGIFAMIFVNGLARAIYSPSMFSVLAMVVSRDRMPQASALGSSVWQGAMIAGPLAAGFVYGAFGVTVASATYVVLMCIGAVGVWRLTAKPATPSLSAKNMLHEVSLGLRFIFSQRIILAALSLDLFAVLFGGAVALLPVYADTILGGGESGLGILRASSSLGSVMMMLWLSYRPLKKHAGTIMLLCVAGFGVTTIFFAVSTVFWVSVALLFAMGVFDSVSVVVRHTILQLYTPEEMRGRVAAANTMFISSSNELGAVESGIAARLMGTVNSVLFGGIMTLVVVGVARWKAKELRELEM